MDSLPSHRFQLMVAVVGLGILATLNTLYPAPVEDWQGLVFYLILFVVSDVIHVPMPRGFLNCSFAVAVPLMMFYGTLITASIHAIASLMGQIATRPNKPARMLFNSSQLSFSTLVGTLGYWVVTGDLIYLQGPGLDIDPLGLGFFMITYMLVNHVLVQGVLCLKLDGKVELRNLTFRMVEIMKWDLLFRALYMPLGVLLAWLYVSQGLIGAAVIIIPLLCAAYIFRLHMILSLANRELTILYEVAQRIGSVLKMEKLFDLIAEAVSRVTKYDVFSLYLWDDAKQELAMMETKHPTPEIFKGMSLRLGQGIIGSVAMNREPEVIKDAMKDPRVVYHSEDQNPPRSLLVVPLVVDDELVGIINAGNSSPSAFSPDQLRMLTILGSQAAVAIQNAVLYKRTEELAITDPMTGLYNYRHFYVRLGEELLRAKAESSALALIYIDVDDFKRYNDTYGHTTGDEILREFADILKQHVRDCDIPVRYAGDEFVALLPNTRSTEAGRVAERIRAAVSDHEFTAPETGEKLTLTISAGVASYPDNAGNEAELICGADQAMYESKRRGCNHVHVAGTDV